MKLPADTPPNPAVEVEKIHSGSSSPFLVFNLFADYFELYGDGSAWTQDILYLLGLLGHSEQAIRSTLLRMKRKGWLEATRRGRRSRYRLSPVGRQITAEGDRRIFEPAAGEWDETWQLVVYSLPEEMRPLRTELRKKLVWFGFGNLASGTWISPRDRRSELAELLDTLAIRENVSIFSARRIEAMTHAEIVGRCWDLPSLARQYESFGERWGPRLTRFSGKKQAAVEERFCERFQLTFEYQPFPRIDPNLPRVLLPADWPGHHARQIFTEYRALLKEGLPQFIANLGRVF